MTDAFAAVGLVAVVLLVIVAVMAVLVGAGATTFLGGAPAPRGARGPARHLAPREAAAARRRFADPAGPPAPAPAPGAALFYNVHEFRDALGEGRRADIAALIAALDAPCVFLAEATPLPAARAALRAYPHLLVAANGGTRLVAAWKDPAAAAVAVPTLAPDGARDCILYASRGLRLAAVHLEIGARPAPETGAPTAAAAGNASIRADNARIRIGQLAALLAHEPDVLLGDFNFELGGDEDRWLRARGFAPVNDDREPSTPFNRVDHCYVRAALAEKFPRSSNSLLPAPYSDHRPMVQLLGQPPP